MNQHFRAPQASSGDNGSGYAACGARGHGGDEPFWRLGRVPYAVVVVELVEQKGLRMVSRLVDADPDAVRIGMPVELRFVPAGPTGTAREVFVPLFPPATRPACIGQAMRVNRMTQLVTKLCPPSTENACSQRADDGVMSVQS